MSGKFGFAVVLLALAAFVASESQSFGGHRRRGRGGCSGGSCATSCAPSGCTTAPAEAAPEAAASPSDAAANTPPAPAAADALASPSDKQPATSVVSSPSRGNYYSTRRARRWSRR